MKVLPCAADFFKVLCEKHYERMEKIMGYSIMEALFDGRLIPWEQHADMSAGRKELEQKIKDEKRYFIEKMSSDDCQRFQALEDLFGEVAVDEEAGIYSRGFATGALLMLEVMEKRCEIINK